MCAVIVPVEHPLKEYRQLVNDQEDRLVVSGAVADELFAVPTPVARIQAGANLHAKLECADLRDVFGEPAQPGADTRKRLVELDARPCAMSAITSSALVASSMSVKRNTPSPVLQSLAKFSHDAGLPHASLSGQ